MPQRNLKKIFAREWLIFITSFGAGLLFVLFLAPSIEDAFDAFVGLSKDTFFAWLFALAPYFLVQIARLTRWSIKTAKAES